MLENFPALNHQDIVFENPSIIIQFDNATDPAFLENPVYLQNVINIRPNSFYLIKSVNLWASVPEAVFQTLQTSGTISDPFAEYNLEVIRQGQTKPLQTVNLYPLKFGSNYGRTETFIRFTTASANNNLQQQLRINVNPLIKFLQSPEWIAYGQSKLFVGLKFEMYSIVKKQWIIDYWERGSIAQNQREYKVPDNALNILKEFKGL